MIIFWLKILAVFGILMLLFGDKSKLRQRFLRKKDGDEQN